MTKSVALMVLRTAASAAVCTLVIYLIFNKKDWNLSIAPAIPSVIALISIIFNYGTFRSISKPSKNFARNYLISRLLKLLANIILFLAIIFLLKDDLLRIIIVYLITFIVLFAQEVIELQLLIKKKNYNES